MSLDLIEEYRVTSSYRLGILISYMCVHSGINDCIKFLTYVVRCALTFLHIGRSREKNYVLSYIIICTHFILYV